MYFRPLIEMALINEHSGSISVNKVALSQRNIQSTYKNSLSPTFPSNYNEECRKILMPG